LKCLFFDGDLDVCVVGVFLRLVAKRYIARETFKAADTLEFPTLRACNGDFLMPATPFIVVVVRTALNSTVVVFSRIALNNTVVIILEPVVLHLRPTCYDQ
jgi:hypothetical protein